MKPEYQLPSPALPTSYSEADFDGYHAAPLLIYGPEASEHLMDRQDRLALNLANAVSEIYTGVVKPGVVDFMSRSIITRMEQREGLNSMSYASRRYKSPRFDLAPLLSPLDVHWAAFQSRIGNGTIRENAITGRVYGMKAVEVANVTVMGDFRSDVRDDMYKSASELVGHNVAPTVDQEYDSIKILGFDRDISTGVQHIGAMRVEMSRPLHSSSSSTLKARTFAIIDTSPSSGFSEETVDRFITSSVRSTPLNSKTIRWLLEREQSTWRVLASNDTLYDVLK